YRRFHRSASTKAAHNRRSYQV
ncbi:hypothetical protein VCHENC02_1222B, partial [Vibrio harveyi]